MRGKPIQTTYELVDIIKDGIPCASRRKGGHPAKRVFQAIRIAVNDELEAFYDVLQICSEKVAAWSYSCYYVPLIRRSTM